MLETINNPNEFLGNFLTEEELKNQLPPEDQEEEEKEIVDKTTKQSNDLEVISDPSQFEDETEDEEADDEKSESTGSYSYKALVSHLSDEGLVDFELAEDAEDSPELVFESIKKTIDKGIESYKESIPDTAKQFLTYLEKGGDPAKYIESYNKPFDPTNLDLTDEVNQEAVVKEYLKSLEYTDEEIDETLQDYKDSLILEKQAALASKKLDKQYSQKQELLLKEQEQYEAQKQEQIKQYVTTVQNTIDTAEQLAGLPLTPKQKEQFKSYLLGVDKEGLTPYQREINENPIQTQLELAFLKFMKYDFSQAKKLGETEAAKKLKNVFKTTETTVKGNSREQTKELDGDLSAFKRFYNK